MPDANLIGREAEKRGERYLRKLGYKIIDRNFRCAFGEIDLIGRDKQDLVFIEIKFRSSDNFGTPKEFVVKEKQSRIIKTALHYLKNKNIKNTNIRFDVLSMGPDKEKTELLKAAFECPSSFIY